jgi:hypothetical protein
MTCHPPGHLAGSWDIDLCRRGRDVLHGYDPRIARRGMLDGIANQASLDLLSNAEPEIARVAGD